MKNSDIATELIQALTKAEINFDLSEILETQGILKDELVTVEFKWGDETLLNCQRAIDSSSGRCNWIQAKGESIETLEKNQLSPSIGQEIAEVFSKAEMLPTFKNILSKRDITISQEKPVIVQLSFAQSMMRFVCPCTPKPCCQI